MKKDLTLLILAAGMGSRFGGIKQLEPVGPNKEFIIDYSINDAIEAGFTKVIFVIKEEHFDLFKETIGARFENKIQVEYAFQKMFDVPEGCIVPKDRIKPLGTVQALYSARNLIHENFALIGADDFYGKNSFKKLASFLLNNKDDEFVTIGYRIKNTLSKNGGVKRGLFEEKDGYVTRIIESVVTEENNKLTASPLDGSTPFEISYEMPVSMIMFGLTPQIFKYIEAGFYDFFEKYEDQLMDKEYLVPDLLEECIKMNLCTIKMIETDANWHGITYKEDLEVVREAIKKYHEEGIY